MTTKQLLSRNVLMGILHIALILFFATQLHSCTDEHTDHPTPNGEEKMITFSVKVPGGFTPATYALTEDDENAINTVDVLLFESGGGNYISGPHYGAIGDEDETRNEVDVTIRIPEGLSGYDMVVLANCRSDINGKDFSGDDKATALAKLIWSVKADKNKPNWLETDGNKTIPMWGEYSSGTVTLTRMLARINVTNNASASFTLSSVHLCNYRDAGNIAPTSTIPAPNKTGISEAILYSGGTVISDNKCINEIYTFEAATADEDDYNLNSPCLVIGGEYNGETYYYRVDFVKKTTDAGVDTYTYLDLLRNHKYEVNIENISGPGYTSAEDALKSRPINVVYAVEEWDDSSMTDVVYNGQYTLAVSQSSFRFTKSGGAGMLTVFTDNPAGCSYEVVDGEDWLTESSVVDASGSKTYITLTVAANGGETPTPREAKIKITSGSLKYAVTIAQSNIDFDLRINNKGEDVTLTFTAPAGETPALQSFTLNWLPEASPISYTSTNAGNYEFDGISVASSGSISSSNGLKLIMLTSTMPFVIGTAVPTKDAVLVDCDPATDATIEFTLDAITRTLTLKQQVWDFFMSNQSGADIPHQSTLSFESLTNVQPDAQTITIAFPANSTAVSASTVDGYTITQSNIDLTVGTATYTIQPAAKSTDVTNETKSVDFTVTYGGLSATKTLSLSQTAVEPYLTLTPTTTILNYYRLNGSSTTINFNTNTPWKVESVTETITNGSPAGSLISNEADILSLTGNAGQGQSITVTADAAAATGGVVTIVFSTLDGSIELETLTLPFAGLYSKGYTDGKVGIEWAGSNIYWKSTGTNTGYLTFDAPNSGDDMKQGVFFKWGSLFGVSPSQSTGNTNNFVTTDTPIFTPWGEATTASALTFADWAAIPFVSSSDLNVSLDELNNYLYYLTDDVSNPSNATRGDICRWISLMNWGPSGASTGWRMPTANEFRATGTGSGAYSKVGSFGSQTSSNFETNNWGNYTITSGYTNTNLGSGKYQPSFPATGWRSNGTLSSVGQGGYYWSGSPNSGSACNLDLNPNDVYLYTSARTSGFSVRCVRDI